MIIDLKKVFVTDNYSLPIEYRLDMSNEEISGIFPLTKPVSFLGTVSNKASIVALKAQMEYDYFAGCDRCGEETFQKITVDIEKSLSVSIEGEDSDDIILVPDMKFDLDDFIYTEVITSLPMKHLCKEDCKGICQKCGKNLNEGECDCPKREIDPRLEALADLLK